MEFKLELDTDMIAHATVAIANAYSLCCVSEHSKSPQIAGANANAFIVIIEFLYGPRPAPIKKST